MKSQKGQTLVETALILPLLILLLCGIVDFGRIFHVYLTLDHAGREAARVATIGAEDGEIYDRIDEATGSLSGGVQRSISPEGKTSRTSGSDVTITLIYDVDFLTPIIGGLIDPLTIKNETIMRVE